MDFHQHPDGQIIIRGDAGEFYIANPGDFETDSGLVLPSLPAGAIERLYRSRAGKAEKNSLVFALKDFPQPFDDAFAMTAETAFANLLAILAARLARLNPPPSDADLRARIAAQLDAEARTRAIAKMVTASAEGGIARAEKAKLAGMSRAELEAYDPKTDPLWS